MFRDHKGNKPKAHSSAYISPHALVIGQVMLSEDVSVWPGCVLRGDVEGIVVREGSNLQDGVLVHTNYDLPVLVGRNVTVGHGAVLHGCKIGDNCLIGINAVVLDGAVVEDGCVVGAGAVVTENSMVPEGSLAVGVPARVARKVTREELKKILHNAKDYVRFAKEYKKQAKRI
ncbi:MAG: gamma carbonic anhydrase family protein [Endomicrobiales bacterium]|nr:gamma carbonic anhydrase family protein [Endomicrobiales bacterium]